MISEVVRVRQGFGEFTKQLQTLPETDMHAPVLRQATSLESVAIPQGKNTKRTKSNASLYIPLDRQCTTVDPTVFSGKGYENMKIVRHRTTDFDLWSIVPEKKSTPKVKVVPVNTPLNQSRPLSEISACEIAKRERKRFPILGPTRQQTEIYFKDKSKELQGLSLQGPGADPESLRRFNSEYSRREERTSENFLNSSRKLRGRWSTITSGSIISRKHKTHVINGDTTDSLHDVRFFAELVKPLQHRLRVHEKEEKEKILFPSKYGFHQRSHSPTFRRLLEATEKLKIIAQHETVQTLLKQNANINERKVTSLKNSETEVLVEHFDESEEPKTPELTVRSANIHQTTFLTEKTSEIHDNSTVSEIPDNVSVISDELEEEEDIDDEDKSEQDHSFKVDFKVAESHAELHLFLPKINNGNKSAKNSKTDVDETSNKTDRSGQISLPSIKVDSIHQIKSYQSQPSKKFKRPEAIKKKKKKPVERVKSAADPDKKIRDHLNDVHTLISIEDHHSSHKSDTICEFAQCPYHSLLKQNQDSNS